MIGPATEGGELIGSMAPSLDDVRWPEGSEPGAGKVTLVRWWTDRCPLCRNSARAFAALRAKYGSDLELRAIYHPKPRGRRVTEREVVAAARRIGMPGAVGLDPDWTVLRRWWTGKPRRYTSVTFLLDRGGRIRLIHTGGEFHGPGQVSDADCVRKPKACRAEYEALDRAVARLLQGA